MAISLASLSRSGSKRAPIVLVHGGPGIGKTTFCANAPGVAFIRAEDGLGNLEVDAFPLALTFEDVIEAMNALYQEESAVRWMCLDSLSALELLIWQKVARDEQKENIEAIGYGKGYVLALSYWQQLMDGVMALSAERGIGSLLIAHSAVTRYENPELDAYDRVQIKLHKLAFGLMFERCDVIGYAAPKVYVTKEKKGMNQTRNRGVDSGERLLHVVETAAYVAKNRYSLPTPLPLDWTQFSTALDTARGITAAQPTTA